MESDPVFASGRSAVGAELDVNGLVELMSGFWVSQVLVAARGVDLFGFLAKVGGADAAQTAAGIGVAERPAEMLLTACAAMGLLAKNGDLFVNAPVADRYLVRGQEDYFGDYIRMLSEFAFPGWLRIDKAVRTNRPTRWAATPSTEIFDTDHRPLWFWDGLYPLSRVTAAALAEAVDLGATTRLLDVGGGGGAFAIELCRRFAHLSTTVFDLAHVCEHTRTRIDAAGLADRIQTFTGDFFAEDDLPGGHDAILLSMILHDWDEPASRELLAKCFRALPSGGRIVISELLVDDDKAGPLDAALMSVNMLIGTHGRNYTAREYQDWLTDAGFTDPRTVRFRAPGANGAVVATKP
ncbi:MAG TPA: methyltransferase [Actinocrinis sp.]|nr:methyltransferase [Actinocrinis sp.]